MQLRDDDQAALWAQDCQALWHPYTRASTIAAGPLPIIARGEGVYLYDVAGRRYFDAISSWWACALGHGQPEVVDAIRRQAGQLQHSILGNLSHPPAIELAARLATLCGGDRKVLFASDGSSAIEAALKIAVQYRANTGKPRKHQLASLEQAYHGDTIGAMSVGYLEQYHAPYKKMLTPVLRAESPCCGTCVHGLTPPGCGWRCFDSMRAIIAEHADDLTAVIVEPLCQGAAGMRIYDPGYLRLLAETCLRHDVLLIVDEIAMGFGRTGTMFAFEQAGIDPDIICIGKGLSAGYLPISATVVRDSIAATFVDQPADHTLYHGHTFTGNPIAAAASLAVLDIYARDRIPALAAEHGRVLASAVAHLRGHPAVHNIRTLGMIAAVELKPVAGRAARIRDHMRENGVLLRPLGDVLYFMPPLTTPDDVMKSAVESLAAALSKVP